MEFRQWYFLRRVLAIVVIGELQNILGHSGKNKSLPQYDYDVYEDADQMPLLSWVYEIPGFSQ